MHLMYTRLWEVDQTQECLYLQGEKNPDLLEG